jgi:nucleotide sugar dehydrogenase
MEKQKTQQQKKVAIVGYGYVGTAYHKVFPDAVIYDPFKGYNDKEAVNNCDLAIVCVPTQMKEDKSADISIVEEVVGWLETPLILIKSTVPPTTTQKLRESTHKRICHSPEYVGEGGYYIPYWKYAHPTEPQHHSFVIVGGEPKDRDEIIDIFQRVLGADKIYFQCTSTASELIKYFENCTIGSRVTLSNVFAKICESFGESYNQVREGLVLDERLGKMFTSVFKDKRGFGGKCIPKDMNAIVQASKKNGYDPKLLQSILDVNDELKTNQ